MVSAMRANSPRRHPCPYRPSLNTPLLRFGRDRWRTRDACEGTVIFGGVGSGKTSGSGRAIARAFLRAGFGGLVLAAKVGEVERWQAYAKETGRSASVMLFDDSGRHRFNFLDYAQATVASAGFEHNLVDMMARIAEAARIADTEPGGGDNPFFRDASMELLAHTFPLLHAAYGRLRLRDVHDFILSAPTTREEADAERWQDGSFCSATLLRAAHRARHDGDAQAARAVDEHGDYWIEQFPRLGDRTRSSIVATLTSTLHPFLSGRLRELFCTETTLTPELCREGAIIIMALPSRRFGKMGAVAQQIFKYLWQLSAERYPVTRRTRPIFLFADEAQFFVNSADAEFLSTSRESRVCPVFITQDTPTLHARLGMRGENAAQAFLSKFQTRIFHANTDHDTNRFAADILGKTTRFNTARSQSIAHNAGSSSNQGEDEGAYGGGHGRTQNVTDSISTYQDDLLRPEYFGQSLRTGGPRHRHRVDAVLVRNARRFHATGQNYLKLEFPQK